MPAVPRLRSHGSPGDAGTGPGLTPPVTKGASGRSRASLGSSLPWGRDRAPARCAPRGESQTGADSSERGCAEEEIASPSSGFLHPGVPLADPSAGPDGVGHSPR